MDRSPAEHNFDPKHRGDLRHYATHIYISRYTIDGRRRTALELYLALSDSPLYRLRCKYEELTYQEAREVIAFLKGKSSMQPSILFSLNERNGRSQEMSPDSTETEADRRSQDTFFLSRLADFPMDKQIRIDRCRELLNELALLGIAPDGMEKARIELRQSVASFDSIEHRMAEVSEEYRKLKRLEQNLTLAANPRFTHGPLFDEKKKSRLKEHL